jgi:secondary thiamine-phosphate synthase enzyme
LAGFAPVQHTSASLLIQENADPAVGRDLMEFFRRAVPENADWNTHRSEGPDDMPAHIRSAITQLSLTIPILEGNSLLEPGKASISSSTGPGRTGARSSCT